MTATEHKLDFKLTTGTPYLALVGCYEVSIMRILKKIDHVIMALICIKIRPSYLYNGESLYWIDLIFVLNRAPGGCFTNISRALQTILSKFIYY